MPEDEDELTVKVAKSSLAKMLLSTTMTNMLLGTVELSNAHKKLLSKIEILMHEAIQEIREGKF